VISIVEEPIFSSTERPKNIGFCHCQGNRQDCEGHLCSACS